MFEMTSPYTPTPSYEHACGVVPNRPSDALYISASLARRPISGQLAFATTVPAISERIGFISERKTFLG